MNNVKRVKILNTKTYLSDKVDTVNLGERIILISNLDKQFSSSNILHQNHHRVGVNEAVDILDDVLMTDQLENINLLKSLLSV